MNQDSMPSAPASNVGEKDQAGDFTSHREPAPCERDPQSLGFFARVAEALVRDFAPHRVFDIGCMQGFLVEALWDRGIQAFGRVRSFSVIGQFRTDIRPFCEIGAICDQIDGRYDLLTCIGALEHLPEQEALRAIQAMADAAPRILFCPEFPFPSPPTPCGDPVHGNALPPAYWLARWAEFGFAPKPAYDAGYVAPDAYVLERSESGRTPTDLADFAERVRLRVALVQLQARLDEMKTSTTRQVEVALARREVQHRRMNGAAAQRTVQARADAVEARAQWAEALQELAKVREEGARIRAEAERIQAVLDDVLASNSWRITWPLRAAKDVVPRALHICGGRFRRITRPKTPHC